MPPVMVSVYSSHVQAIGHDNDKQELHVRWNGGKTSVYSGVPAAVADDVSKAWSVGKAVREQIIPNYQHKYAGSGI